MKKIILLLSIIVLNLHTNAQESAIKYGHKVKTLETTIQTLYNVVSGPQGEKRDWDLYKYLFLQDAKLIPSRKNEEGYYITRYMSPSDYISISETWLIENGFFEKEIHRTVDIFGNIAHVFSTYESYQNETDLKPYMSGLKSIQLFFDGFRWWIVNIYWTQETEDNPIPVEYLPRSRY
ncbi:hypothetical protein [Xanthomarina sp. F2636L]|uniref:hypothetical protein n=1 Tax=Xanthomarina sp. F2636L TaxID=2996018 RepID=UPI00225DF03F|nr:hypothetical protein [Xanthomarina sp. F2636L]MCX7552170.1 hypothetical protein [Xanthomarina sp. F2636L]